MPGHLYAAAPRYFLPGTGLRRERLIEAKRMDNLLSATDRNKHGTKPVSNHRSSQRFHSSPNVCRSSTVYRNPGNLFTLGTPARVEGNAPRDAPLRAQAAPFLHPEIPVGATSPAAPSILPESIRLRSLLLSKLIARSACGPTLSRLGLDSWSRNTSQ